MGEIKEASKSLSFTVIAIIVGFILVMALSYAYLYAQPAYLKQQRENYKASYQYSEGKNTELLNFVSSYNKLETRKQKYIGANATAYAEEIKNIETQQAVLADQIRMDAELVPDQSRLPKSVKDFLINHPE